ncbi:MFS transporter [Bellilinea sp.]|uniref:MFS transporter n=1 Tax=Bellilinea caldifistulae TaxID=360411 RepID=A0A7C4Q3H3_9CHLR|nr:MFS transporter [Bellilinea sp.]
MMNTDLQPRNMRTFLVIWIGQVISIIGSGLTSFALGVWIYQQTGQATPFAITVLFGTLPRILLTPLAGSLADRWNRRWLMILADTGNALVTLAVVFLVMSDSLRIWNIYLVALAGSLFAAFQEPAYTASITMLVPKKDLARASGLMQVAQSMEMLIAPLLAGILFGVIGLRGIVLIDFLTYFFAVGALLIVRIPQPPLTSQIEQDGRGKIWRDALFGWQYLRQRRGLFNLLVYFALVNFLLNLASVLTGPLVLSFSTPAVLGAVQTATGFGMLTGSLVLGVWGGPKRRIFGVLGFIGLGSVAVLAIGLRANPFWIATGFFVFLFSVPIASGLSQAIFQTKVAPDVQGRVFAIRSLISRSIMPLAFLLAGPLADQVFEPLMRPGGVLAEGLPGMLIGAGAGRGIGLMFVISGILLMVATAFAFLNPRIRNLENELPDAIPDKLLAEQFVEEGETMAVLAED